MGKHVPVLATTANVGQQFLSGWEKNEYGFCLA